jgi:two-component system sensor histidine kinase TctE
VAHQLRTPLAGLKTQLEWLQQHAERNAETTHVLQMMAGAAERTIRKTNQLLALARAEPDRFEASRLVEVDLVDVVTGSMHHFVEQADRKTIDLGFELQPAVILGDRFLLSDLVDNIVDNAIRYSPADGVVTVRCYPLPAGACFEVEDSGPGIQDSERERIFSRYYRLDSQSSGTGLGLAIVRDIASDHGADIQISHLEASTGTRFRVCFPSRAGMKPGQAA